MLLLCHRHDFWNVIFHSSFVQLLRPIYKQIAENQNAEIFSANTLFVVLGTSLLTARVGVRIAAFPFFLWVIHVTIEVIIWMYCASLTLLLFSKCKFHLKQAGLSMALGAFLAGLLLAETEFSLQVESDIAPYRGLLLGLFFMTVGAWYSNSKFY